MQRMRARATSHEARLASPAKAGCCTAWWSVGGRDRARATKDIDIVLRDTTADLADSLEQALTGEPYQGFSFRRKGQPFLLDNGAVNMEFGVTYKGQPWTSATVDIARAEFETLGTRLRLVVLTEEELFAKGTRRPRSDAPHPAS